MSDEIKKDWGAEFKYAGNLPTTTTFYGGEDRWVMRISESGIEVNEEVSVTYAARAVLDCVKDMLPKWVGLTDDDMKDPRTHNFNFIDGARWAEEKLRSKNGG